MGATRDSGRRVARIAAAVVFAALAAGMSPADAQESRSTSASPVVDIVGDGGVIRAAGAHVAITGTASRIDAAARTAGQSIDEAGTVPFSRRDPLA